MNQNDKSKLFLRFLKDNDAFKIYEKNFSKNHNENLFEFIENTSDVNLLIESFNWNNTDDYGFWWDLNNKWYWLLKVETVIKPIKFFTI